MAKSKLFKRKNSWFRLDELKAFYPNKPITIENGKIDSFYMDGEDHGIFSISIGLNWGYQGTSYGGYALDSPSATYQDEREPCLEFGHIFQSLKSILNPFDCIGKTIRILFVNDRVQAIGDLLDDKWFGFEIMFDFLRFLKTIQIPQLNDMLYPQMAHKFDKTITKKDWIYLQKKAHFELLQNELEEGCAVQDVIDHWQSIVDGKVPFGFQVRD